MDIYTMKSLVTSDLSNYEEVLEKLGKGLGSFTVAEKTMEMRHYEQFGCGVVVSWCEISESSTYGRTINTRFGVISEDDEHYCINEWNEIDEIFHGSYSTYWAESLADALKNTVKYLDSIMNKDKTNQWYVSFK